MVSSLPKYERIKSPLQALADHVVGAVSEPRCGNKWDSPRGGLLPDVFDLGAEDVKLLSSG